MISRSWRANAAFFDPLTSLIFKCLSRCEPRSFLCCPTHTRQHVCCLTQAARYWISAVLSGVTLKRMLRKLVSRPQTLTSHLDDWSMTATLLYYISEMCLKTVPYQFPHCWLLVWWDLVIFAPQWLTCLQFHFTCLGVNRGVVCPSCGRLFQILHGGGGDISLLITRC